MTYTQTVFRQSLRSPAFLLLVLPATIAAQSSPADAVSQAAIEPTVLASPTPRPTLGWVLENNKSSIPSAFGSAAFESAGTGSNPALARDGAGNIDGAALVGGLPTGQPVSRYALAGANQASLSAGTTVVLLCGRENNWLRSRNGAVLPVKAGTRDWSVFKSGEWGMSLVSSISPFSVVAAGQWVYAHAPPIPFGFARFGADSEFPAQAANSPLCAWGFYDASIQGSASQPEISAAYDDGAASAPVKLAKAAGASAKPLEIVLSQLGADLGTLFIWQGSSARPLFEQSVRAAYWNGGLRRSIESGFQTPDWNGLAVTDLDPRPIALGGDALDNVQAVSYPDFVRTSPFARYSVTTAPNTPFLAVRYRLGNSPEPALEYSVSFVLDGNYLGYDQPWRYGTNLRSIPLPQDGRSHTLELRNGFTRGNGNYAAPTAGSFGGGGFIDAVGVLPGHKVTVNHPVIPSVALVLSHSVAVGEAAGEAPYLGQGPQSSTAWPVQARAVRAFGAASVVDESYGGQMLWNDCATQTACDNYLAAIKAAQPHIVVGFVARMLNDFYHGPGTFGECLPEYEAALQNLFNAWAGEFPGVPLHVGSDIREAAWREELLDGCSPSLKLADWRAGIESAVENYAAVNDASWLHFADMTDWVPQSQLLSGGIHPTAEGQISLCQSVAGYFHQQAVCAIPR